MSYPKNLRYTKDHEWAELMTPTQVRIGITDHAQSSLGDIVFLDLPKVGRELKAHETFGVVESIKAVSDLFSPMNGKVIEANTDLATDPAKINTDAHTEWMLTIEASDAKSQFDALLDSEAYESFVKSI